MGLSCFLLTLELLGGPVWILLSAIKKMHLEIVKINEIVAKENLKNPWVNL